LSHYAIDGKQYDIFINGQTGVVFGETPPGGLMDWLEKIIDS
jgi:hypothetical protein